MAPRIFTDADFVEAAPVPAGPRIFTDADFVQEQPKGLIDRAADWLLTRPSGERISPAQAIVGPFQTALQGMTFNMGDELTAGANALIDRVSGQSDDMGQAYDARLNQMRGYEENLAKASPVASTGLSLMGALRMPIASTVKGTDSLKKAGLKLAGEGGLMGALYGFGGGEGGLEKRLDDAASAAKVGAIASPLLGVPMIAAGRALEKTATKLPETAAEFDRRSLGATKTHYNSSADDLKLPFEHLSDDVPLETEMKKAMNFIANKIDDTRDPSVVLKRSLNAEREISKEIAADIAKATEAQRGKIAPQFERSWQYIKDGKIPAGQMDAAKDTIKTLADKIRTEGNGKLSFIQQQKIAQGGKYEIGNNAMNGFYRSLYHDLQDVIERYVPTVAQKNAELKNWKIGIPVLRKALSGSEGKNPIQDLIQNVRTSGGVGGLLLLSALMGGSVAGVPGLAAGYAVGYSRTPAGQHAIAKGLTSPALKAAIDTSAIGAGAVARNLPRALASQMSDQDQATPKTQSRLKLGSSRGGFPAIRGTPQPPKSRPPYSSKLASRSPVKAWTRSPSGKWERPGDDGSGKTRSQSPTFDKTAIDGLISQQPPVVQAIIRVESAGKADAVSAKGARGLMQLMPENAKRFGVDPGDPAQNIQAGIALLQEEMQRFGDVRLALAAYNAGSPSVQKAIRKAGGKSWEKVKMYLPIETRNYVPKVLAEMRALSA